MNTLEPGMCEGLGWGLERGYIVLSGVAPTPIHIMPPYFVV